MPKGEELKPFQWKPGQSGNPAGKPKNSRRSFDAVRRLEELGVDPLEEVIALARDPTVLKATRLKAWMALMDYAYSILRGAIQLDGEVDGPYGLRLSQACPGST
jgi:uncharacterized protein DUF5681